MSKLKKIFNPQFSTPLKVKSQFLEFFVVYRTVLIILIIEYC